ncbi:recombinase family protein, partial [Amycolatopsis magusensis]
MSFDMPTIRLGSAPKRKRAEWPELLQLMEMAATGAIQKILVSEISRLGRKTSEMLDLIERLSELKVSVYAKNLGMETLLDTSRRAQAVLGRQTVMATPWLTERHGYDPTW